MNRVARFGRIRSLRRHRRQELLISLAQAREEARRTAALAEAAARRLEAAQAEFAHRGGAPQAAEDWLWGKRRVESGVELARLAEIQRLRADRLVRLRQVDMIRARVQEEQAIHLENTARERIARRNLLGERRQFDETASRRHLKAGEDE